MAAALTEEELIAYVAGWRARDQQHAERAAIWRDEVRGHVDEAARLLVERFGATRVVLFGSLVRGTAGPGSDVDLLVEGLPAATFFDAAAAVDRVLGDVLVDLVPAEFARPEVLERARAEGEVLRG